MNPVSESCPVDAGWAYDCLVNHNLVSTTDDRETKLCEEVSRFSQGVVGGIISSVHFWVDERSSR